mmetsp:Transcript_11329/g.28703  ORF Transcript_11329/g.28703 Transcript_11329/m.28703 type:complete len:206 (-) Transcript_11329:665-1282(-)
MKRRSTSTSLAPRSPRPSPMPSRASRRRRRRARAAPALAARRAPKPVARRRRPTILARASRSRSRSSSPRRPLARCRNSLVSCPRSHRPRRRRLSRTPRSRLSLALWRNRSQICLLRMCSVRAPRQRRPTSARLPGCSCAKFSSSTRSPTSPAPRRCATAGACSAASSPRTSTRSTRSPYASPSRLSRRWCQQRLTRHRGASSCI